MPPLSLASFQPVVRRGVVAVVTRGDAFLVVRRAENIAAPGLLCFPGGGIEPGESEPQALLREFQEELGALLTPRRRIWRCQTAWHVDLAWWLAEIAPAGQLVANPAEVAALHWLSADDLGRRTDLLDSNHEFLRHVSAGRVGVR